MNKRSADDLIRSGRNTLLLSFFVNLPGPMIIGISLFGGASYTLLAEFIRKTLVLISIFVSLVIYCFCNQLDLSKSRKKRYEFIANIIVGGVMCLSGTAFFCVALLSDTAGDGNVAVGLTVSVLSAMLNLYFYFKIKRLLKKEYNAVLSAQGIMNLSRLMLDCIVSLVYIIILAPAGNRLTHFVDQAGSVIVSVVVVYRGIKMIFSEVKARLQ